MLSPILRICCLPPLQRSLSVGGSRWPVSPDFPQFSIPIRHFRVPEAAKMPHSISVESRAGAVAAGRGELLLPAAFASAPVPRSSPWPRFLPPLIEPDVRISRIRLSDQAPPQGVREGDFGSRLAFRYSLRCSVWIFLGVARLIVNRLCPVLLRRHPGTRAPSLPRHYPASSVLRAPPPPAPARRPWRLLVLLPVRPPERASRVARCSLSACRHPPPRRSGSDLSSGLPSKPCQPSPGPGRAAFAS